MAVNLNDFLENRQIERDYIIGTVVDNLDIPPGLPGNIPEGTKKKRPTYGTGRVKIRIPGMTDFETDNGTETHIPIEDLPWVGIASSLGTGTSSGVGKFVVPAIGTKVIVKKINDEYGWLVVGEINSTKHQIGDYHENYPNTWGMRDRTGTKSVINMEKLIAFLQHASGTSLEIVKSGAVNAEILDDLNVHVVNNVTDVYDGKHEETIGEYRKTYISGNLDEEIVGVYSGTYRDNYNQAIDGSYKSTILGSSEYTINGDLNVSSQGSINISSTSVIKLTAPLVKVEGNIEVSGSIFANGSISVPGTSLGGHVHPGVQSGTSFTGTGQG